MKYIYVFVFMVLGAFSLFSQEIQIKQVSILAEDNSAYRRPRVDGNGDTCALVKLKTNHIVNIDFPNHSQYIEANEVSPGEYEIYVPTISKRINFKHSDYLPGQINLGDYGYRKLISGKTYLVILEAPKRKKLASTIVFKIQPTSAQLTFDGIEQSSGQSIYELKVEPGMHDYVVKSTNFVTKNGMVQISESETQQVFVSLEPIFHDVQINCNVDNARLYVDDVDYGIIGRRMLPQGEHRIRVQAKGYSDYEDIRQIDESTATISIILERNSSVLHIHAVPVKVYAKTNSIYINGKRVEDWSNGTVINLLPDKQYRFEGSEGKSIKVKIKKDTHVINFDFSTGKYDFSEPSNGKDIKTNKTRIPTRSWSQSRNRW